MFFLCVCTLMLHSCLARLVNHPCIKDSISFKYEQNTFADLVRKGKNFISLDLIYNFTTFEPYALTDKKWIWIAHDYKYLLRYPRDVDVFSFGLLGANTAKLIVQITTGNISKACESDFDTFLVEYFSRIIENGTSTYTVKYGHICYAKIKTDKARDYLSNISGVKFGFLFWCYNESNTEEVEKSYIIYIAICFVLLVYSFYPIIIEVPFYIEDRKTDSGNYYMSDSPYCLSNCCKCLFFSGNNKYIATLRILICVILLTTLVYYLKSEIYNVCNCSLEINIYETIFFDAENLYINSPLAIILGVIHFILVNVCVIFNSDGKFDDFDLIDLTKLSRGSFFMKTVSVSEFLPRWENEKLMSYKIKKLSLLFSFQFWTRALFANSIKNKENRKWLFFHLLCPLQLIANFALVLCCILCPVLFTVYILFVKFPLDRLCPKNACLRILSDVLLRAIAVAYLIITYLWSFNIFFNGLSYVIQFLIFTLLVAVPRLPIQYYIYAIYFTSMMFYIARYFHQFTKLYKKLLESILTIREQNSISIKHFNIIVSRHFPISNEVFYLCVKILFSCLFFAIVYDTMESVGNIKLGAQPDLTMVFSLFFIYGPPRLLEAIFMKDFTSRVYMKENKIKEDLEALANGKDPFALENPYEIKLCNSCCTKNCVCTPLRYICSFCCGCFQCPVDDNDLCDCCVFLTTGSVDEKISIVKCPNVFIQQDQSPSEKSGISNSCTDEMNTHL